MSMPVTLARAFAAPAKISASHQTVMAMGSVGAWAVMLGGAPFWAPYAGERMAAVREKVKMPKFRFPHGTRITIPRVGSVGL